MKQKHAFYASIDVKFRLHWPVPRQVQEMRGFLYLFILVLGSVELYSYCSYYVLGISSTISSLRNVFNVLSFCLALTKQRNLVPKFLRCYPFFPNITNYVFQI